MIVFANTLLDMVHHRGAYDLFSMRDAHMIHRASHDFRLFFSAGMPVAAGDKSSTFKTLHDRFLRHRLKEA